jgi:hypothetical protein
MAYRLPPGIQPVCAKAECSGSTEANERARFCEAHSQVRGSYDQPSEFSYTPPWFYSTGNGRAPKYINASEDDAGAR